MKTIQYILIAIVFILIGWFSNTAWHLPRGSNPITVIKPRPLDKYSIDNLSKAIVKPSQIEIGKVSSGLRTLTDKIADWINKSPEHY